MNDADFVRNDAAEDEPCELIQALSLAEVYNLVTLPPPFGEDIRSHAPTCHKCTARIEQAHRCHMDTLPAEERAEIQQLTGLVLAAWRTRRKLHVIDSVRDAATPASLVSVEVVQSAEHSRVLLAASHESPVVPPKRRSFLIVWTHGGHEWSLEGLSQGRTHEMVLSSADGVQATAIAWKNTATGRIEQLRLERSADGRTLVRGIKKPQAQKRALALRDAIDETTQADLLPFVQVAGEIE